MNLSLPLYLRAEGASVVAVWSVRAFEARWLALAEFLSWSDAHLEQILNSHPPLTAKPKTHTHTHTHTHTQHHPVPSAQPNPKPSQAHSKERCLNNGLGFDFIPAEHHPSHHLVHSIPAFVLGAEWSIRGTSGMTNYILSSRTTS